MERTLPDDNATHAAATAARRPQFGAGGRECKSRRHHADDERGCPIEHQRAGGFLMYRRTAIVTSCQKEFMTRFSHGQVRGTTTVTKETKDTKKSGVEDVQRTNYIVRLRRSRSIARYSRQWR